VSSKVGIRQSDRMPIKRGSAGKLVRILNLEQAPVVGAGGFGIVVRTRTNEVIKLIKDTVAYDMLAKEANIQAAVYRILDMHVPEVRVPRLTYYSAQSTVYKNTPYLCGIGMKYLKPPLDFTEQVHMLLGYTQDDIDTEWGMRMSDPVSETNPTRGFFASPETLSYIWRQEGSTMTLEKLGYLMGKTLRTLLDHNILPIDLEWVWSQGRPCLIDFGLCMYGTADPMEFLKARGVHGLADDFYIPHIGDVGFDAFMAGYCAVSESR
jgi:hypothetical protein